MLQISNKTVRDIALESPLTTRVFEEFKIDFCCGGRIPFDVACAKAGVDPSVVRAKLDLIMEKQPDSQVKEDRSSVELIEHIVEKHHVFTRSEISRLLPLAEKVAVRHGDNHPELLTIQKLFTELTDELLPHMRKEETVLFPYIEQIESASTGRLPIPLAHFGTVQNPVRMMMFEHDRAGEILKSLRSLSGDYTAPDDACPSFKGLYAGLEDLEKDLHQHIHLENNILFPQAVEMEKNLFQAAVV